jgi:hypothetical protein
MKANNINQNQIYTLLDTTGSDTGDEILFTLPALANDIDGILDIELSAGDTVEIQGRLSDTGSWKTLDDASFTANGIKQLKLPLRIRALRTVVGSGNA